MDHPQRVERLRTAALVWIVVLGAIAWPLTAAAQDADPSGFPRRGREATPRKTAPAEPEPATEPVPSEEVPPAVNEPDPGSRAPAAEPYAYPPFDPDQPYDPVEPAPQPARDGPGVVVGVGGGVFQPWNGRLGGMGAVQGFASLLDGRLRVGGEFEGRTYRTEVFGVNDVDVQSYVLRPMAAWVFFPDRITPYLGLGLGLYVNVWDRSEIEAARPGLELSGNTGTAGGVTGLAGLEAPIGPHFAVFLEGRASAAIQFTTECDTFRNVYGYQVRVCDDTRSDQLGGATGMLGVRYRF